MSFDPFKRSISELNKLNPDKGLALIAEPFMKDPYFKRSVVFITEHNDEGTVGLMLNKPMDIKLNELVLDFPEFDSNVFLGGPVQPQNLFFLHTKGELLKDSAVISDGLYWNGDFDDLKAQIIKGKIQPKDIKFFLGYSGWGTEQLDDELKENSWFVKKINQAQILKDSSSNLWKEIIQSAEDRVSMMANFPEDPSLN